MPNKHVLKRFEELVTAAPVFLDTETTGLGSDAEICEIAVIGFDGVVLLNTLVKPRHPIPDVAVAIHHITNEMVKDAPSFAEVLPELERAIDGRHVCIYNADYDMRMIKQSALAYGIVHIFPIHCTCIMKAYAAYWGRWNELHKSNRWQPLSRAVQQQCLRLPEGIDLHRARADAEVTRLLVRHLGGCDLPMESAGRLEINIDFEGDSS